MVPDMSVNMDRMPPETESKSDELTRLAHSAHLTDSQFRILAIILIGYNSTTHDTRISLPEIAKYAGKSVRTVQRCIDTLAEQGYLQIKLRGVGRGNVSAYLVTMDALNRARQPAVSDE